MYNSLIKQVLAVKKLVHSAKLDACVELLQAEEEQYQSYPNDERANGARGEVMIEKVRGINSAIMNEYGFSSEADYMVMQEWVKQQKKCGVSVFSHSDCFHEHLEAYDAAIDKILGE